MTKFILQIELGNEAMQNKEDIVEALRKYAANIEYDLNERDGFIRDRNGNRVRHWKITR